MNGGCPGIHYEPPPAAVADRLYEPETAECVEHVRGLAGVEYVQVLDLRLEDLFEDMVKAQRAAR